MSTIRNGVIFIAVLAILSQLFFRYWVYIPALIDYVNYPLPEPNKEMIWKKPPEIPDRSQDKRPNIVIILADDLGFNDISFYSGGFGHGRVRTPSIDSIGNDGIAFTQAYAGHATCAPSRASLLTGKYPTRVGYEYTPSSSWTAWVLGKFMNNGPLKGIYHEKNAKNDSERFSFPLNHQLIPEALSEYGYNSIQFGKWHNGYDAISAPINRGFNQSLGFNLISSYLPVNHPDSMNCYAEDTFDRLIWANVRYGVKADNGKYFRPKGYLTDYIAEEATKAIEINKNNPFFLYVAMTSIHTPLQSLRSDYEICQHRLVKETKEKESISDFDSGSDLHCNSVYGGMILALDRAVGTILNALEKNNLSDNTIVIFTSDNGGTSVVNQRHINYPFRGWKATFFDGGLRVPLLMKWPKYIPKYQMNSDIVSHIDLFPTLLQAAGATTTPNGLDGVSVLPYILPDSFPHQKSRNTDDTGTQTDSQYCQSNSQIHKTLFWRSGHYLSLRHCQWKYQISLNPKKRWLYDVTSDPQEKNNLAESSDETILAVLDDLAQMLQRENERQVEPLWASLSETPLLVDKIYRESYVEGDEYIYWPN
jgi:arylsulfatase A-like enzyme